MTSKSNRKSLVIGWREERQDDPTVGFLPGYREKRVIYRCVAPHCEAECEGAALFCKSHLARAR
jgi:hypothetical protein